MVLYVLFEDFEGGSTHGAKEETATPKSALMTTPIDRTELVEQSGCALAFERADAAAQDNCGRTAQEEVDVVFVELPHAGMHAFLTDSLEDGSYLE